MDLASLSNENESAAGQILLKSRDEGVGFWKGVVRLKPEPSGKDCFANRAGIRKPKDR